MSLDIVNSLVKDLKKGRHIVSHHMAKISLVDAIWPWYLFLFVFLMNQTLCNLLTVCKFQEIKPSN